jgi:aromatic ring-opening dioxygenase catalytic subunit (LigB family)
MRLFPSQLSLTTTFKGHALPKSIMRAPVIAICHGGGPMPLLNDPSHEHIVKSLRTRVPAILNLQSEHKPKAILLLTAHWQTEQVTISSSSKHEMYYDYYGFPPETYKFKHDASGDPDVAQLVSKTLTEAGIKSVLDSKRGAYSVARSTALKAVSLSNRTLLM